LDRTQPSTVAASGFVLGDAGGSHACAVDSQQSLWCWGEDRFGQLGVNGTGADALVPQSVAGGPWQNALALGAHHSCAIDSSGTLACWGKNDRGQLGIGTLQDRSQPSPLTGSGPWLQISAGGDLTCGIKTDHTLWCW